MPTRDVADRLAIEDVLVRYCAAIDAGDWARLDAVFLPDATVDYTSAGGIRGTYPEVRAWLADVLPRFAVRQHLVTNLELTVDGDVATSRVYFFNPMGTREADGTLRMFYVGGWYHDRWARTRDGWRIADRREETAWMDGRPMPRP
jgi:3-phenylpropionate/cinnamic acid dioxygenase small subunit